VNLTTHLHLVSKPRMVELYLHFPLRWRGVMPKYLNTGVTLHLHGPVGLFCIECDTARRGRTLQDPGVHGNTLPQIQRGEEGHCRMQVCTATHPRRYGEERKDTAGCRCAWRHTRAGHSRKSALREAATRGQCQDTPQQAAATDSVTCGRDATSYVRPGRTPGTVLERPQEDDTTRRAVDKKRMRPA
jgi:hypothetical protein